MDLFSLARLILYPELTTQFPAILRPFICQKVQLIWQLKIEWKEFIRDIFFTGKTWLMWENKLQL